LNESFCHILFYKDKPLDYMKRKTNEILHMSDPNMITAYSWAAGLLFQQELPSSLADVEKRASLVNEINTPLIQGKGTSEAAGAMLMDLDDNERSRRLDDISQVSMSYLTEQLDDMIRKNILLRLWTGCIDAAKAIRFNYVAGGVRDVQVIEAPITIY
jgi:DNA helicase IV